MSEVKRYIVSGVLLNFDDLSPADDVRRVVDEKDYDALAEKLSIMVECADNYSRMFEEVSDERDALAAENERLRVKLMTIASAEPGRHNIEWAKAMAATGNNEAHAKWRAAFDQRDKLAGLLADVKADYTHAIHWEDLHATMKRIDAALAEVKPCPESPAPTT